jgi:myo-inositol-1(or 4)-monophosphatase
MDLKPWDSAAGALLVREAGGAITHFDGSAYDHYDKQVLASNGLIHRQMMHTLTIKPSKLNPKW